MCHDRQPRVALAVDPTFAELRHPEIERNIHGYKKLDVLSANGSVVLRDGPAIPPEEWERLEYVDWKSGGDTNFAPLASAMGEMECAGFWDHGKPDKDGMWTSNREIAPTLCKLRRGGRREVTGACG